MASGIQSMFARSLSSPPTCRGHLNLSPHTKHAVSELVVACDQGSAAGGPDGVNSTSTTSTHCSADTEQVAKHVEKLVARTSKQRFARAGVRSKIPKAKASPSSCSRYPWTSSSFRMPCPSAAEQKKSSLSCVMPDDFVEGGVELSMEETPEAGKCNSEIRFDDMDDSPTFARFKRALTMSDVPDSFIFSPGERVTLGRFTIWALS